MIEDYVRLKHPKIIESLFYKLGYYASNRGVNNISESWVRDNLDEIISVQMKNTPFDGATEKIQRFDSCIWERKNKKPFAVFEIKTFFKNNESVSDNTILLDISKLYNYKSANPAIKTYLLLVGTKSKLNNRKGKKSLEIGKVIDENFKNNRKYQEVDLSNMNTDIKLKKANKSKKATLRPSVKKYDSNFCCMSWEIKLNK